MHFRATNFASILIGAQQTECNWSWFSHFDCFTFCVNWLFSLSFVLSTGTFEPNVVGIAVRRTKSTESVNTNDAGKTSSRSAEQAIFTTEENNHIRSGLHNRWVQKQFVCTLSVSIKHTRRKFSGKNSWVTRTFHFISFCYCFWNVTSRALTRNSTLIRFGLFFFLAKTQANINDAVNAQRTFKPQLVSFQSFGWAKFYCQKTIIQFEYFRFSPTHENRTILHAFSCDVCNRCIENIFIHRPSQLHRRRIFYTWFQMHFLVRH